MKRTLILVIVLFAGISAFGQTSAFQRTYTIGMQALLESVQQTTDKGFIMTGFQNTLPPWRVELIKTDSAGAVQWAYEYGKNLFLSVEDPTAMAMMHCVRQTSDGGYIISGDLNGDCYLLKVTSTGGISWARTYGGGDGSSGYYVKQTTDGGYIVTGTCNSFDAKDSCNVYLLKTASNGNATWEKVYKVSTLYKDIGYAVEQTPDGYLVAGETEQVFGTDTVSDILLIKTDNSGNLQWGRTYGTDANIDYAYHIKKTSDNGYLISGATDMSVISGDGSDAFVFKINSAYNMEWNAAYHVGNVDEGVRVDEKNGNYYLFGTGISIFSLSFLDMFALELDDANGNVLDVDIYTQTFGMNMTRDAHVTQDGGYVIGGWGQTLTMDFYLVKTDINGSSSCNEHDDNAVKRAYSPDPETPTVTVTNGGSHTAVTALQYNLSVTENVICQVIPLQADAGPAKNTCQGTGVSIGGAPTADGGTSPYTYAWSPATGLSSTTVANPTANPSSTTTYTVTVSDNAGATATSSVTVTVLTLPTANAGSDASYCNGQSTTLGASGGGTYAWSPATGLSATNIWNPVASPASTTTYTVVVTGGNGCTASDQVVVTVNPLPTANAGSDAAYCFGGSTNLNASGGNGYSWSPSAGLSATNVSNPVASPSATTTYTVTVSNTYSCTATDQVTVTVNALPAADAGSDATVCLGESVNLNASGGTGYNWSPGTGLSATNIPNPVASPTGTTTYTVTVTDGNSCSNTDQITITVNTVPVAEAGNNTAICDGSSTQLTASGGMTYQWSPATGLSDAAIFNPVASPANTTTYYVTVTSGINCSATDSVTVSVNPLPTVQNVTGGGSFCPGSTGASVGLDMTQTGIEYSIMNGATVEDTFIGDGNAYSDMFNQPGTYTITAEDQITGCTATMAGSAVLSTWPAPSIDSVITTDALCNGIDNGTLTIYAQDADSFSIDNGTTYQTSSLFTGLATGPYNISVMSSNGCWATTTATVGEPSTIQANETVTNPVCGANGTISVAVTGGSPAYIYEWSHDTLVTGNLAVQLAPGSYSVTVTDQNGCNEIVSVNLTAGAGLGTAGITDQDNVSCYGYADGSATVAMTDGIAPYTYTWSNNPLNNTPTSTGMMQGLYYVTISDGYNCSSVVAVNISEPAILSATAGASDITCNGNNDGMAISNVTGGTTPYGYAWSNLATTPTVTGLAAGSYGLTVTDANGCTDQAVFSISEPTAITVNATGSDPTCYGVLDGTLSAEVTGGNPTYTYTWFDGTNTYNGSPVLNAGPGTYSLTVTDQNGCNGLDVVTLASPPYFGFSSGTASLGSDHYGQIDIEVSGGAPAYGYQWSNGQTTQDIGGLSSGYYMVTVTDQQGCMIMDTFLVGVPLVIPDAISPNGDGINDDFEIINIQAYSEVSIQVFNRWDQLLFTFEGSGYEYMQTENRWDGTQNGKDLPFGTYLYIIKLNGLDPIAGPVVIVH